MKNDNTTILLTIWNIFLIILFVTAYTFQSPFITPGSVVDNAGEDRINEDVKIHARLIIDQFFEENATLKFKFAFSYFINSSFYLFGQEYQEFTLQTSGSSAQFEKMNLYHYNRSTDEYIGGPPETIFFDIQTTSKGIFQTKNNIYSKPFDQYEFELEMDFITFNNYPLDINDEINFQIITDKDVNSDWGYEFTSKTDMDISDKILEMTISVRKTLEYSIFTIFIMILLFLMFYLALGREREFEIMLLVLFSSTTNLVANSGALQSLEILVYRILAIASSLFILMTLFKQDLVPKTETTEFESKNKFEVVKDKVTLSVKFSCFPIFYSLFLKLSKDSSIYYILGSPYEPLYYWSNIFAITTLIAFLPFAIFFFLNGLYFILIEVGRYLATYQ